ncbi:cupin domain-containing protein [Micromonospora sp. M12]
MLIKGTALVWYDDQEYEVAEGGVVFLPKGVPHAYRITSDRADLLMINTPAGIEGMFRASGRDKSTLARRTSRSRRTRQSPRNTETSSSARPADPYTAPARPDIYGPLPGHAAGH